RLRESPARARSRDPPEGADPTRRGELARARSLGGSQALELLGIAVGGPEHLDVDEEFHRLSLPSRMRHRSMPRWISVFRGSTRVRSGPHDGTKGGHVLTIRAIQAVPLVAPLGRVFRGSDYQMTKRCTVITRVLTA